MEIPYTPMAVVPVPSCPPLLITTLPSLIAMSPPKLFELFVSSMLPLPIFVKPEVPARIELSVVRVPSPFTAMIGEVVPDGGVNVSVPPVNK